MRAYFVRMTANKQVVGLFVASSISSLAADVDECCDPEACEYAVARSGGIMLEAPTAATWPLSDPPKGKGTGYKFATGLEGGSLSQKWGTTCGTTARRWIGSRCGVPSAGRLPAEAAHQAENPDRLKSPSRQVLGRTVQTMLLQAAAPTLRR